MSKLTIENFRCFGEGNDRFELSLRPGLTAMVGENEARKTAVIDALRFALGTTDQEWLRLEDADFHVSGNIQSKEIKIILKFEGLNTEDKRSLLEYLTYGEKPGDEPVFYFNWTAKDTKEMVRGRPYRRVEVHSGKNGEGLSIAPELREWFLRATYLRPLRDAVESLSAGRGSRLAQVLRHSQFLQTGADYDPQKPLPDQILSVEAIGKLINSLLESQQGVKAARSEINKNLKELALNRDHLESTIKVGATTESADSLVKELLEKLDLRLGGKGNPGLGSDNLLFIACELLLLAQTSEGVKLLLIEEPEAHLHAQRQLRVMGFLQTQAKEKGIQIIVTTHSPNLASAIKLDNIVMIHNRRTYSMAQGQTELDPSDYRFLERFLDVTKANLFFARGVMIVEGDAENILLPTLAKLIGRDFTEHGVSIVNVGGIGLRRYARIFQRKGVKPEQKDLQLAIPVACVTDMDVMPNCAPTILGKLKDGDAWPEPNARRWRARKDFADAVTMAQYRAKREAKTSGQFVKPFVSDEWTLEYDLALGPPDTAKHFVAALAEEVFVAACLAKKDEEISSGKKKNEKVEAAAIKVFARLKADAQSKDGCTTEEVLASYVYAKFAKEGGVQADYCATPGRAPAAEV